jgi:hypothetical protein
MTIPNRTVNRPQLWNGKSLPCFCLDASASFRCVLDNTSPKISVSDCVFEDTCLALPLLVCLAISITIQRYDKGMTIPNRLAVSPRSNTGVVLPCPCPCLAVSPTKNVNISAPNFAVSLTSPLRVLVSSKTQKYFHRWGVNFHHHKNMGRFKAF